NSRPRMWLLLMADLTIKSGDTAPPVGAQLFYKDGSPLDLTGCTVWFVMRKVGASVNAVNSRANVKDPTSGYVSYDWQSTDTAVPGEYNAGWRIVFPDNTVRSVPSSGHN